MSNKENDPCLKEKLGTCCGCNVMAIAILQMRWQGLTLDEATGSIHKEYCPVKPDHAGRHINREASIAFGQRRHENVEFTHDRRPLRQKPRKGRPHTKMSKSSTGKFFRDQEPSYI
jgi:hypothetical protein